MDGAEPSHLLREAEEGGPWQPELSAVAHLLAEEAPGPLVTSQIPPRKSPWHGSPASRASRSGLLSALGASPKGDLSSGTTKKILLCREDQFRP